MASKGRKTFTIEIVVGIVFRDQAFAYQLINQEIAVFGARIEQLIEIFEQISIGNGKVYVLAECFYIVKVNKGHKSQQLKNNGIKNLCCQFLIGRKKAE